MASKKKTAKPAEIDPKVEAEVQAVIAEQAPPPPPIQNNRPTPRAYTALETREQIRFCESLMIQGARPMEIWRLMRAQWPVTQLRVKTLMDRVKQDWLSLQKDEDRMAKREAQIRRIHEMRRVASGLRDPRDPTGATWIRPPNHQAVARYEALLMQIEGTSEPIRVDVNVAYTEAMLTVVAQLSGDRGTELLEEAMEQQRLAELAKRELPALAMESAPGRVIEVEAE